MIKNKQDLGRIQGLSQEEVNERVKKGQVNTAVQAPTKTVGEIIRSNSLTYFYQLLDRYFAGITR